MEDNQVKFSSTNEKKPQTNLTKFKGESLLHKLRKHFKSYCNHTSIHGFQYFGQNRTLAEKCWWIVIFICIISGCGFAIYLIYNKWKQSPVIVSLTTKDTPIYQVPFPAVTICPTIKFSSSVINFSEIFKKLNNIDMYDENATLVSEQELELFQYMLPLCKPGLSWIFDGFYESNNTISEEIYEKFLNNTPRNELNSAAFMEKDLDFSKEFHPLLTEDGLCLTFNMLSTNDLFTENTFVHEGYTTSGPESTWVPQTGFSPEAGLYTYPRRALLSGALNSLDIKLYHLKRDIDLKCTGAQQGYKVILHMPTRIPRPALEFMMAPFGKSSSISVSPEMITTSDVVKSYAAEQRDCYFPGEKNLQFFKVYSKTNCDFECLTNFTLNECDCVSFEMPREPATPVCGISQRHCVIMARKKYNLSKLRSKLDQDMEKLYQKKTVRKRPQKPSGSTKNSTRRSKRQESPLEEDLNEDFSRCYCLRSCFDITYKGKESVMDYDWRSQIMFEDFDNLSSTEIDSTQITIYLDTNTVFTKEVNELYGPTDFLSNFGGLLGLFTGFSILSFMEIIYFCTLRILGNRRIVGHWYGDLDDD